MKVLAFPLKVPMLIALGLVKIYQLSISPLFPSVCRFSPTCSEYAVQALKKYGFLKGTFLAIKRIGSCHPWGRHGHDPLP